MRDDFGVFILSHGRPETVALTITALTTGGYRSAGYTGRWWIVLDDEDPTAEQYAERWGRDRLLFFNKDREAETFSRTRDPPGEPMTASTLRRTSTYSLRLDADDRHHLDALSPHLPALVDRGDTSLSWRASSDEDAIKQATVALLAGGLTELPAVLTTGLGVHRRTVATN